jgi:serine/threonine-protein kinase
MLRRNKRSLGMLLAALVGCIAFSGCYAQSPGLTPLPTFSAPENNSTSIMPSTLMSYENLSYGFKMGYPQDWTMKEAEPNNMNMVVGFLGPGEDMAKPMNYVVVQVQSLPAKQNISLDQYGQTVVNNLKKTYNDFNLLSTNNINISNSPAKELVYTFSSNKSPYKLMLAYTMQNNKAYVITYCASPSKYAEFEGGAKTMISSFKFT